MNASEPVASTPSSVPRPKYGQILALGFGSFGVSALWAIYNLFVPLTLDGRFHLSAVWIGFFMTLDNIWQLLVTAPIGAWSDRLRTPFGRRLPFVMVGAPVAAVAFGILPLVHVLPIFVISTNILLISMALWRTPAVALIADLVPSPFRSQANGIVNFMAGIGGIFAYLGSSMLSKSEPSLAFWLGSGLIMVALVVLLVCIREPKTYQTPDVEEVAAPGVVESILLIARDRDRSALCLLLAISFWMIGYSAIESFFGLYVKDYLGFAPKVAESKASLLLAQLSVVFVLVALPVGYLGVKVGRRATISAGLVFMAALLFAMYALPVPTLLIPLFTLPFFSVVPLVGGLLMLAGVAWAMIIIHAWPMVVDLGTTDRAGTYTGLYYFFSTLAAIIGPIVNGQMVKFNGGNYNAVMLLATFCMLIAFGLMLGVKKGDSRQPLVIAAEA